MKKAIYNPGEIVKLGGIEFVVLDNNMSGSSAEEKTLFILALKSQGQIRFGNDNNYTNSALRDAVCDWLNSLADNGVNVDAIMPRMVDLTTVDGKKGYGSLELKAAPLTMDEARKYAEVIPHCDDATWLSTGWGGKEHFGSALALGVFADGLWYYNYCSFSCGVRPALVIPSSLLDPEDEKPANDKTGLEDIPTEDLLKELLRRANKNK